MEQNKSLGLLSLARKGGNIVLGEEQAGDALGTTSCAIAAITDVQLALAFVKTLGEPEKYADLLQELDERVKRVEKRRAEEKAHRRNVRHGKS